MNVEESLPADLRSDAYILLEESIRRNGFTRRTLVDALTRLAEYEPKPKNERLLRKTAFEVLEK